MSGIPADAPVERVRTNHSVHETIVAASPGQGELGDPPSHVGQLEVQNAGQFVPVPQQVVADEVAMHESHR